MRENVTERGVGLYEAALWLVALLPVALVAVSVVALIHDQGHLSGVPAAVLRESPLRGLRWVPDGVTGRFEADSARLRTQIAMVALNAVMEARQGMLKADSVSAKACFWVFSVNSSTGRLETPIWSECEAQGPFGGDLSMTADLEREQGTFRGIAVSEGKGFVERVIVAGVIVAAQTGHLLDPRSTYMLSKGAIAFPRQEVEL